MSSVSPTCVKTVEGEWKDQSAGGPMDCVTCRFNPQYFLRAKGALSVHLSLEISLPTGGGISAEGPPNIGFFIVKGEQTVGYPIVAHGKDIVFKTDFAQHKVEADFTVDNVSQFTIVPCTQAPQQNAKFTLTAKCVSPDPSFLSLEPPKFKWNTCLVTGEWHGPSAGGCANYPLTFLKNPQFLLKVARNTKLCLLLLQKQASESLQDTIGFYIARTNGTVPLRELTRKELVSKSSFGSKKEAVKVQDLSEGDYVIIPCTFDPGYNNNFTLIAFSDCEIFVTECNTINSPMITKKGSRSADSKEEKEECASKTNKFEEIQDQDISSFPLVASMKGEWNVKTDTAGGCMNHPSWRKNPQYFLDIQQSGEYIVTLQQDDRKNKKLLNVIGFYISRGDGRRKLTVIAKDLMGKSSFKRTKEVGCKVYLEASDNPYVIIPCTFRPDTNATYELSVRSKNETPCLYACPHSWNSISLKEEWKGKSAGGCKNNATWVYNPQFLLKVHRPCNVLLILTQHTDKPASHGFYVFNSSGSPNGNIFYPDEAKVVTKSIFIDDEEVWKELDLYGCRKAETPDMIEEDSSKGPTNPGNRTNRSLTVHESAAGPFEIRSYTIVPSTFDPKIERQFTMTVHYDGDINNVSFIPVQSLQLKEVRVQGSWEQNSSGGCINFPITFKNNPHYYFRSSHAVKSIVLLNQHPSATGGPTQTIGFYITTVGETGRRLLRVTKQQLIAKSQFINKSYVWIEFDMEANEKYVIIVCTFSPRVLGHYTLTVLVPFSSPILPTLYAPPDDWVFNSFEGEWKGETAAGSKDFSENWRNNPSYHLTLKENTIVSIFLSQQNDIALPIGFYILKGATKLKKATDGKSVKKSKSVAKQKLVEWSDFIRTTEVSKEGLNLKKGSYTIVVSCLLQGQEGYFVLTTYSDKDIILEPLQKAAVLLGNAEDKRQQVATEMLTTEQTYVKNLDIVNRCFLEPLKAFSNTEEGRERGMGPQKIKLLFSNMVVLLKYNQALLIDLEARLATWGKMSKLGDIFLKMASFLMIYAEYCNGYPQAIITYRELKKDEAMMTFFNSCQATTGQKLSLNDYLIMPVQRIPRYVMLLKELLKYTPPDHPDFSDLQSARFKIEQVTQALDAKKQQAENLAKLMSIADMITKKGTQRVAEAHRRYIREGKLTVERDGKKNLYYVFLFNDSLFLTVPERSGGKYKFRDRVDFKEGMETVITSVDTTLPDLGFLLVRKKTAKESKVRGFYASSEEEKTSWVIDIQSQLHDLESVRSVAFSSSSLDIPNKN